MLVERTVPSILCIGDQAFYPGMNSVSSELAPMITENAMFKEQCSIGHLKLIKAATNSVPSAGEDQHEHLAKEIMAIKESKKAAEIAAKTLSIGTLRLLVKNDSRKTVQKAAQERLDEMLAVSESKKAE